MSGISHFPEVLDFPQLMMLPLLAEENKINMCNICNMSNGF
jgi:hypothetical protein